MSIKTSNASAGTSSGPKAFIDTFTRVSQYWQILAFEFTYKSYTLGKTVVSPFSIHAKVKDGKITYLQFMEDTLATTDTFKVSGTSKYHSDPSGSEFEL